MKIKSVIFALLMGLFALGGCVASVGPDYGYYPPAQPYYGYGRGYYAPRRVIVVPQRGYYHGGNGGGYRGEGGYRRGGGYGGGGYNGGGRGHHGRD
jgi:hypothetical protein